MMIRFYILQYQIQLNTGLEDRQSIYKNNERQVWIKEYFRLKDSWYVENIKAFIVKTEVEMSHENMLKLKEDI